MTFFGHLRLKKLKNGSITNVAQRRGQLTDNLAGDQNADLKQTLQPKRHCTT